MSGFEDDQRIFEFEAQDRIDFTVNADAPSSTGICLVESNYVEFWAVPLDPITGKSMPDQ